MPKKQVCVVDSNEIILGLKGANLYAKSLLDNLNILNQIYEFRINDQIEQEVARNLSAVTREKWSRLLALSVIRSEKYISSKALIDKYQNLGLKKGDIIIAAYAEEARAHLLISENRHFLKELKIMPFKILTAEQFIRETLE